MIINYDKLPEIDKLKYVDLSDDLFVCALGFENRCVGAPRLLAKNDYKTKNTIILKYDVHEEDNNVNYYELKELIDHITLNNVIEISYKTNDVESFYTDSKGFKKITNKLYDDWSMKKISVDISSFTTIAIIQILDYLFTLNVNKIRIIYTEAEKYYPKDIQKADEEEYISSGVKNILSVPKFSGIHTPGYSQLLIVLLGFEPIRTRGIFNILQPSRKIGIIGKPSRTDLKWRLNLLSRMYKNVFGDQDEILMLSEFNYIEVFKALEEIYDKYGQVNNMTITPLGSKMQTIAVLLFLRNHPDVQLLVSIPIKYDPRRYSEGIGDSFQLAFFLKNKGNKDYSFAN